MPISITDLPKKKIAALANMPRDIFQPFEGNTAGFTVRLHEDLGGIGLDVIIANNAEATGSAIVTFDKTKVVTVAPGQTFTLTNVLFAVIEVTGTGIKVDCYVTGISWEAIGQWALVKHI